MPTWRRPRPTISASYDLYGLSPVGQVVTTDGLTDGGQVGYYGAGSGKTYWVNAKWQANLSGLYQLPAGFEVAGNLYARQGYPRITTISSPNSIYGSLPAIASPIGDIRTPTVVNVDLRLAKHFRLGGRASLNVTADVFNLLNQGTVLVRNGSASSNVFNRIDEILAPRIARFGVRLGTARPSSAQAPAARSGSRCSATPSTPGGLLSTTTRSACAFAIPPRAGSARPFKP